MLRAPTIVKNSMFVRGATILDRDWMPGPYPKNEAERKAAAKKYNLLPEEYEPLDLKWDLGQGDYPALPNRCWADEDPYGDYTYMADSRYFGDLVHPHWEIYQSHGVSLNEENPPFKHAILTHGFMFVFIYWYIQLMENYPFITEMKPQHMYGTEHYHYPTSKLEYYE